MLLLAAQCFAAATQRPHSFPVPGRSGSRSWRGRVRMPPHAETRFAYGDVAASGGLQPDVEWSGGGDLLDLGQGQADAAAEPVDLIVLDGGQVVELQGDDSAQDSCGLDQGVGAQDEEAGAV